MQKKVTIRLLILLVLGVILFMILQTNKLPESRTSPTDNDTLSWLAQNAVSGGPPKDGIPAIDEPAYTSAEQAEEWLLPNDVVFGVVYGDFIAAYPQRILVWHEIANEQVGGQQLSVTYCPLTGTVIGFLGSLEPEIATSFGVSGKLVNSNLIMYDRASDSLWPQILGKAISGSQKGATLKEFPVIWTTWEKWKHAYPETSVLSQETGFFRNYGEGGDPYGSYLSEQQGYYASDRMLFKPLHEDNRLAPKEVIVGMRDAQGHAVAIRKETLREEKSMEVPLGETLVVVTYREELDTYDARTKGTDEWVNAFDAMWFAWVAFYPDTQLWL